MSSKYTNSDLKLRDGLYRLDHPDSDLFLSRPIRKSGMGLVDHYNEYLREKRNESNKCSVSYQSDQSSESDQRSQPDCGGSHHANTDNPNFQHICPNNPILTCNCGDPNDCPELGDDPDNQHVKPNKYGNIVCPDSGKLCSINVCDKGCKGDSTKSEDTSFIGSPCVIVGSYSETTDYSAKPVPRTGHISEPTSEHIDTRSDFDGLIGHTTPAPNKQT